MRGKEAGLTFLSGVISTVVDDLKQIQHAFAELSATFLRCHRFGNDITIPSRNFKVCEKAGSEILEVVAD